jgi:DNA-binding response OmpR family regulator
LLYNLLVARLGQPVSRDEILRGVWAREKHAIPGSNIIDVYIRYLRVKLAQAAPNLRIVTLRNTGYSLQLKEPEDTEG